MKLRILIGVALLSGAQGLFADVSYQETVQYTGGSLVEMMRGMQGGLMGKMIGNRMGRALQDKTFKIYLKGNKMARISDDLSMIIDTDAGTMTTIDHAKRTYSTVTLQEMQQRMEEARQKMNRGGSQDENIQFDAKIDETGNSRNIDGQTAKEYVMNLAAKGAGEQNAAMKVRSDMWLASKVSGMEEIRAFQRRMADQIGLINGFNPMMGSASAGLGQLVKQMQKLDGFPLVQDVSVSGVQSPMAGMMGNSASTGGDSGPFLTMNTQTSGFSDASVADTVFQIPAGYKEQKQRR
jgi:hypothetical protein